nr:ankyrin repeat domain-containing protein [uncultured Macellibacteroides sp.]
MMLDKKLEKAVLLGDLSLTKSLLANGFNIDGKDKYGRTILYDAIVKGFKDIVLELCLAKINVNHQDNNGKTPLHFASVHHQLDIAKILIHYGANVNLRDENGNTPLFDAVFNSKGNPDIILLLKENDADYQTPNNYGVSPKELAETIANFDVSYLFK